MSYTQIGFVEQKRAVVYLRLALEVMNITDWTRKVPEALRLAFRDNVPMKDFYHASLSGIGAHPAFPVNTSAHSVLITLVTMCLEDAGFVSNVAKFIDYRTDPVLKFSELVERIVSHRVAPMSQQTFPQGADTRWGAFIYEFVLHIQDVARVNADRLEVANDLLTYRKQIVRAISRGALLDSHSRSFILNYMNESRYLDYDMVVSRSIDLSAAASTKGKLVGATIDHPRILATWAEAKQHFEPGPISRFFRLVSNQSMESLIALTTPGCRTLPLSVGSIIPYGIYLMIQSRPVAGAELAFSDESQLTGLRETTAYLRVATSGVAGNINAELATPAWPALIDTRLFAPFYNTGIPFDLEGVELRLRSDSEAMDPKDPYFGLAAGWFSAWRDRQVSTLTGATAYDMLTDLALANRSYGGGELGNVTIDDGTIVSATSVERSTEAGKRILSFGSTAPINGNTMELNPMGSMKCPIFYRRGGGLHAKEIDMRWFYARRGAAFIRPAFAEQMIPTLAMLYAPNDNAVDYVAGELGLSDEEVLANKVAITVCFNHFQVRAIVGPHAYAGVNLKSIISNLVQI